MLLGFLLAVLLNLLILGLSHNSPFLNKNSNREGVQNVHNSNVPRVGGIAIFASFFVSLYFADIKTNIIWFLWLSSLPVFIVGVYEDLSSGISPLIRLLFIFFSITTVFSLLGIGIFSLGFEWVDYLFSRYVIASLLFTVLIVGAAVNSTNVIDGLNGLLGGYSIIASVAIAYVSYSLGDELVLSLALVLTASIFGFFVVNFPFGKVFMGDGGAYFIGFMLAVIGLMLSGRHTEVSNWFVLLIFMYPMYELLYSIFRRIFISKVSASEPDNRHLHSLVYRRLACRDTFKVSLAMYNSMAASLMWVLSLLAIIPAVVWFDNQTILIVFAFVFMTVYSVIYKYVVSDQSSLEID